MKTKNIYWLSAGIVNLFGAFVHTIAGQTSLVDPMLASDMPYQNLSEMVAAWHMITVILFLSSLYLIRFGLGLYSSSPKITFEFISYFYILSSAVFIIVSILQQVFAPQWILLLPISILGLIGLKKSKHG